MPRFHILPFGCQMNVADADWLAQALLAQGWSMGTEDDADLLVVMTCSVREKPEQKVYSLLGRIKDAVQSRPGAFVAVGGCVAQQIGEALWQRFPFVRLVFGTDGVAMVPQAVARLHMEPELRISLLDFLDYYPERDQVAGAKRAQAFVNIMQGCDNFCAYCIVPFTRGRQKSRAADAIMAECTGLVQQGVREITLLGQNVNSYGQDQHGDGTSFADLLARVAALPGLDRLHFTTSHPKDIAPEVITAFGALPALSPRLHLPVQSGADAILQAMGRRYSRAQYLDIVAGLREHCPQIALTSDIIVGFPGETDADFAATLSLLHEVRFVSSFSFKYSDRPGVRAERLPFKVPEEEKAERLRIFQEAQNTITAAELSALVGSEAEVLVEGQSKKQEHDTIFWTGRDGGGRVVNFSASTENLIGRMVPVRIIAAKKHSLVAEIRGTPW